MAAAALCAGLADSRCRHWRCGRRFSAISPSWSPSSRASSTSLRQRRCAGTGGCGASPRHLRLADGGGAASADGDFRRPAVRDLWERRAGVVRLTYGDGKIVSLPTGLTAWNEPPGRRAACFGGAAAAGAARLSRARGRRDRGLLPSASAEEQKVLARVGVPANVRLACQLRPPPALPDHAAAAGVERSGRGLSPPAAGRMAASAMCYPVRRHTRLHLDLGRPSCPTTGVPAQPLFPRHRQAIEAAGAGSTIHRRWRDGDLRPQRRGALACRQALDAATRMARALDDLNEAMSATSMLRYESASAFMPSAIVGEMGYDAPPSSQHRRIGMKADADS